MRRRIVITGAAGSIARRVRPLLRESWSERVLVDIADPGPLESGETAVVDSVTDTDAMTRAVADAELVVHLGGFASERGWADILAVNIDGTHSVLEACRRAGVRRVLLASSNHAVGFSTVDEVRGVPVPAARPDSYYGVGKVAMEALGSLYGDRFGMTVVSARLGTAEPEPHSVRTLSTWISMPDLARLVDAVANLDAPGHRVVWGFSANTRGFVDRTEGRRIGYLPVDDAERWAGRFRDEDPLPGDARIGAGFLALPLGGGA